MALMVFIITISLVSLALNTSSIKDTLVKLNTSSINRKNRRRKGLKMSKIIESLIGKRCKISKNNGEEIFECLILEVDEQWIKVEISAHKNNDVLVMRVDAIENIMILDNGEDL